MKLKKMNYNVFRLYNPLKNELLATGKYKGYKFQIWKRGLGPCAYVKIPKDHPCFQCSEEVIGQEVLVHGGITFCGPTLWEEENDDYWIRWDYMHGGDYMPLLPEGKKWTTREIYKEVKLVILQLIQCKRKGELQQ